MGKNNRTVFRVKPRFFLILAVLLALILTPILLVRESRRPVRVTADTLRESIRADGVVLRKETVVAADKTGQIELLIAESDMVSQGDAVLEVFSARCSSETIDELARVRNEIVAYQRENVLGDILDEELERLDGEIARLTDETAQALEANDLAQIRTLSAELRTAMEERGAHLSENEREDTALSQLRTREERIADQLAKATTTVAAPAAGRVSFSFDGCEHILNADQLSSLTAKSVIASAKNGSMQRVTQATEYTSLFRVVDTAGWYLVLTEDASLVPGQSYAFRVESIPDTTFFGTVQEDPALLENGLTVLFVNDDPLPVLAARSVHVTVEKEFQGLCIPKRSIVKVDGTSGVYRIDGDTKVFCPVTVLCTQRGRAVVSCEGLSIGDSIRK